MSDRDATTLLLADDHPLVLRGLSDLIATEPAFEIVATCSDGSIALEQIRRLVPDIAIVDCNMPCCSGLELLKEIKSAAIPTRIVLLTAGIPDTDIVLALSDDVDGLIMKNAAPDSLLECLAEVASGGRWLPLESVGAAVDRESQRRVRAEKLFGNLTRREREIIVLAAQGLLNKEIAANLDISEGTVKIHLHNVYDKLSVSSREGLSLSINEYLDFLFSSSPQI